MGMLLRMRKKYNTDIYIYYTTNINVYKMYVNKIPCIIDKDKTSS